jgi:hypothetical protein
MVRISRILTIVALAMVITAGLASNGSASSMSWGGQVFGGFDTFKMGDWNDAIDQANASGSNFDNVKSGYSFGVGPTLTVNGTWQLGAHFEMLMGKKSDDAASGQSLQPSANAFGVSAMYLFPSKSSMSYALGGGVDYMTLTGKLDSPGTSAKIEGSGVGGQLLGMTNYAFSPMFSGNLSAGYRLANISIDKIGGSSTSGSPLQSEDYSGVIARVGISFHQPSHN